jgi:hypothetical protein
LAEISRRGSTKETILYLDTLDLATHRRLPIFILILLLVTAIEYQPSLLRMKFIRLSILIMATLALAGEKLAFHSHQ